MKIVVSSQSQVKLDAVKNALTALGIEAEIIGIKVKSNVPEQPMDDETLLGARNRAANAATHARQLAPDADLYISIENGIYTQTDGRYIDKAVVLAVAKDGTEAIAYSEGVEFPKDCVEEARRRGFDTTTVGKVMQELGIVEKHDDPHLTLREDGGLPIYWAKR